MLGIGLGLTSRGRPYAAAAVPWVPTDLGVKLPAWFKADSLTNGAVTSWTDVVGGVVLAQAVAGNKPTKAAASFNGAYPGVTLTTDDFMNLAPVPAAWPISTASVELWAVVDQKSLVADTTARSFFVYGTTTTASSVQLRRVVVSTVNRHQPSIGATTLTDAVTDFSGPHVVAGVAYGTTQEAWTDGALRATGTTTLSTVNTRVTLGANNSASPTVFAEVCVRHLFVIAGTLTATASGEKDKLFGWCHWDSGLQSLLPVGQPYKSAPP